MPRKPRETDASASVGALIHKKDKRTNIPTRELADQDLSIPTVPIYIQEKVSPQALIENLRQQQKREKPGPQANLFADFNGNEEVAIFVKERPGMHSKEFTFTEDSRPGQKILPIIIAPKD